MESTECYSSATFESQPSDKVELLIKANLSNLGRSADGKSVVYRSLDIEGQSLRDISVLRRYRYLETLNLSYNSATDLEALNDMSYLCYLNVAHNNLSELLNFKPPLSLQVADFSDNQIEEMKDLSEHHALRELNISKNNIQAIQGLGALHRLTHLDLANNQITRMENLSSLPLECLHLSGNMISTIENLDSLKQLQVLDLSNNQISGLRGLQDHPLLHTLDLHGNQISDLAQVTHLLDLGMLATLDLRQNPIQNEGQYRMFFVFSLPGLVNLDRTPVPPEEKVSAKNQFSPSRELMATKRHMFHVTKALQQPVRLKFSTLTHPSEPYPMLLLCGPLGAGKGYMVRRLVEDFPTYFGLGTSHTTRPPREDEQDGREYYFITEETFTAAEEAGDFLQSQDRGPYRYGLSVAAVEMVAQHGLACVIHMGIEGALELKSAYFEPRYVLTVPMDSKCHLSRLHRRKCFSEEDMVRALEEAELFKDLNRDRPGFFDAIINCDSLDDAYKSLRSLVMEYAGITPNSLIQSSDSIPPSALQQSRERDALSDNTPSGLYYTDDDDDDDDDDSPTTTTGTASYSQPSQGQSSESQSKNASSQTSTALQPSGRDTPSPHSPRPLPTPPWFTSGEKTGQDRSSAPGSQPTSARDRLSAHKEGLVQDPSPSKFRNMRAVSHSWSRPSTSTSQHSSHSHTGRGHHYSQDQVGARRLHQAIEAVQSGGLGRATTTQQQSHRSQSIHTHTSTSNYSVRGDDQRKTAQSFEPTGQTKGYSSTRGDQDSVGDDDVSSTMGTSTLGSASSFSRNSLGGSVGGSMSPVSIASV